MGDTPAVNQSQIPSEPRKAPQKKPFYKTLWGRVLIGVAIAIVYGYVYPNSAITMKPLGDGFIRQSPW